MESTARDKKSSYTCGACGSELSENHNGIRCTQGHDLCTDCSKNYVSNMLSEPEINIPAKCALCKHELNPRYVEMQLDKDQQDIFLMYMAMQGMTADDEMVVN